MSFIISQRHLDLYSTLAKTLKEKNDRERWLLGFFLLRFIGTLLHWFDTVILLISNG